MKKLIHSLGIIIISILLAAILYVLYVYTSYHRIEDNELLETKGIASWDQVNVGKEYTIGSQNIGFGAYTAEFSFFMDGGTESRAASKESVIDCTSKAVDTLKKYNPNIVLFQETDTNSDRSHHVNQEEYITKYYSGYSSVFAYNFKSAYLLYPVNKPHGKSESGILTLSNIKINSGIRKSLPVTDGFSKLFDLDRCYSKVRMDVDNGRELVIYNIHSSAYVTSGDIREQQVKLLVNDIQSEYDAGNYCITGGDFNSDFTGDSVSILNNGETSDVEWAQPFPEDLLTPNIKRALSYTCGKELPSCRNCDIPYKEGNFTIIVDGFLVTDNVEVTYLENVQTGFEYSDHNPVVMKFVLKE